jgi:hypothetical protein
MLDEPPATSCLSPTLKDTEQQTLRRYFQFIGVSFTDINARLPFWRHRAAGASAQVWQGMAQMHGPTLDGRARDTGKCPEHIVFRREIHWRPTCRDALPTEGEGEDASEQVDHHFNDCCAYGWYELGDWAGRKHLRAGQRFYAGSRHHQPGQRARLWDEELHAASR